MAWYDDLAGVSGAEILTEDRLKAWPDRAMDNRLNQLRYCPVIASEIYQLARHLPLILIEEDGQPCVMVDFRAETLRRPAFDAEGRLLRSYRPAVTRLLPYFTTPQGRPMRLVDTAGPPDISRPPELRQSLALMLRDQGIGVRLLSEAAEILVSEGLVTPGQIGNGPLEWHPLLSSAPRPSSHRPSLPGTPTPAHFRALRLLAVLEFSQVHRREPPPQGGESRQLQSLLSRDEALRKQTFLIQDDLIDFSALWPET